MLPGVVLASRLGEPLSFSASWWLIFPGHQAPKHKESLRDLLYYFNLALLSYRVQVMSILILTIMMTMPQNNPKPLDILAICLFVTNFIHNPGHMASPTLSNTARGLFFHLRYPAGGLVLDHPSWVFLF